MAQNYRNQPNRPERFRGGRYQTGGERDRYRTGGEQRFNPERSDYSRQARGFEGDRSYSQGGYSEEFGYQRGRNRDDYGERDYGAQQEDDIGRYRSEGRSYEDRSSWDYGPSREMQSFRGRGPQGYRRSDERLKEMICERLTEDPMIDASDITVEVKDQTVKLTGTVDDRGTKYEIEELIERCGGVKDIDNQVRVRTSRWDFGSGSSSTFGSAGGRP